VKSATKLGTILGDKKQRPIEGSSEYETGQRDTAAEETSPGRQSPIEQGEDEV